jgi:4-carboxymuconolactone decarboxylase
MTNAMQQPGGRLPLLHAADLDTERHRLRDIFEKSWMVWADKTPFIARGVDDTYIGPFNPLLYSPKIAAAFLELQVSEGAETTLDERVRQVVILAVGAVWQSDYEVYAHRAAAVRAGFSEAEAAMLGRGEPCAALSAEEALAQRVALTMAREHRLNDELYKEAEATFGVRGLVDLTMLAGCYLLVCWLLNIFDVPSPT